MVYVTQPTPTAPSPAPPPEAARPQGARERGRGGPPVLSVRGLKTHFRLDEGVVRAVDGVSFDLYPGEVLGMVGEGGCGKSITGGSILGLLQPPGRIVAGEFRYRRPEPQGEARRRCRPFEADLAKLPAQGRRMRQVRGG